MNFSFNLKEKSAHFDADVEKLVEKHMDQREKNPKEKKTRYQIKQEEKRKNEALKHKHEMQKIYIGIAVFAGIMALLLVMSLLGIE